VPGTAWAKSVLMLPSAWISRGILVGLVLLGSVSQPHATAHAAREGGSLLVDVQAGAVTLQVDGVPLDEVLGEIRAKSGISLVIHGSRPEKVSADFASLPLEDALRRLIEKNFLLLFAPAPGEPILEVWVGGSVGSRSRPSEASPEHGGPTRSEESILDSLSPAASRAEARQRSMALLALGRSGASGALGPALRALEEDPDPDVRGSAIWALEDLGGPQATAAMTVAMSGDGDASVRQRAMEAVVRVGGEQVLEPLARALKEDPEPFLRYEALVNLSDIGGAHVIASLHQALGDPHELIRSKAEEMLGVQAFTQEVARGRAK